MSGKRLLDAAALVKASGAVASKHVALRQHQLDAYSRTSSLAKAIKLQTDRVTLTYKAASALVDRLNETSSNFSTSSAQHDRRPTHQSLDRHQSHQNSTERSGVSLRDDTNSTPGQDTETYAAPSPSASPVKPLSVEHGQQDEALKPEESARSSIPNPEAERMTTHLRDASHSQGQSEAQIPSKTANPPSVEEKILPGAESPDGAVGKIRVVEDQDVFYDQPRSNGVVHSSLPHVKLPLVTEDIQDGNEPASEKKLNQDVFYSSSRNATGHSQQQALPKSQALPEKDDLPEEAYSELFQSRRVSQIFRRKPNQSQTSKGLGATAAESLPLKSTKSATEKDDESMQARLPLDEDRVQPQNQPNNTKSSSVGDEDAPGDEDTRNLAAEIAKNSSQPTAETQEVCQIANITRMIEPTKIRNFRSCRA